MRLKIMVRQLAPEAAEAVTSTTQPNKRTCLEFEKQHEKPSRMAKRQRMVYFHKNRTQLSPLERLPSELQHMIYTYALREGQSSDPGFSSRTAAVGLVKKFPKRTSILRVSKNINVEASQAFYDTVTRPVSLTM
jgi:hypothetical protein